MPVGPFPDFNSCIQAQIKRGYSTEVARKVCGKIEQITKNSKTQELAKITGMEAKREQLGMSPSEFYAIPREPPSASKLPIFDEAHTRNAMARWNQVQGVSAEEKASAKRKIIAKAKHFGIDTKGFEEQ